MLGVVYANAVVVDTSAAVALVDERDGLHELAQQSLNRLRADHVLCAVDVTAHESFTRLRYNRSLELAELGYGLLRGSDVRTLAFQSVDEQKALSLVRKYAGKVLSFHDALCAAVMLRNGLFRVFSFDADFWVFGFEVVPGTTRAR
jgi:predicted nucleic acid-binding protein